MNAQILDSNISSQEFEEHCIKVLQVVKKNQSEIVLKYNAGTADYVDSQNNFITTKVSEKCKKIIFSSKTSLKQKVHALESLF